jgi:two-component system CheB/CheR fusion protein
LASKKSHKSPRSETGQADLPEGQPTDLIVAIGASGASPQSVELFLKELPLEKDLTVVLIFQHREALDDGRFKQALAEHGRELALATEGTPVETGKIYWSEPNTILTLENRHFRCRTAKEAPGERGTIDSFFVSVAEDQERKVIGIIFSGTGGDGILGFAAIKESDGLTLAEETDQVVLEGLAASSSPAALADFILPVE